MKGFVPTPTHLVDKMVGRLFADRPPSQHSRVLDPGCGTGAFIEGVLRWCDKNENEVPVIVGIESDPRHAREALKKFGLHPNVEIRIQDFLDAPHGKFDYVIGNPPYVSITQLSPTERTRYRRRFSSARGRFDLYLLFFEQALRCLEPGGRLVFVTPEKFTYVHTAGPLRRVLSSTWVEEIELLPEDIFEGLVTYPAVTSVVKTTSRPPTRIVQRGGRTMRVRLPIGDQSWMKHLQGVTTKEKRPTSTLADAAARISCGVATGADSVFVVKNSGLSPALAAFARPTVAGRQIGIRGLATDESMLLPYTSSGELLPESELGALGEYLRRPEHLKALLRRTCIRRKPWFAFHETPVLSEMLAPKILFKDIVKDPFFVVDEDGGLVPRHSVYYVVPRAPRRLHELADYLNSDAASCWLRAHCQRAANGYLRLQSNVLKELPLPSGLVDAPGALISERRLERPLGVSG